MVCVSVFFDHKVVCCVFSPFFASSSSIVAFVATNPTLQIDNTHEHTGRRQRCCLSRAQCRYCCRFCALRGVSGVPISALLVVLLVG